jgi:hypothetical protein
MQTAGANQIKRTKKGSPGRWKNMCKSLIHLRNRENRVAAAQGVRKTGLRTGGMAQVVVHLPSKCEALSLSPSTAKKDFDFVCENDGQVTKVS